MFVMRRGETVMRRTPQFAPFARRFVEIVKISAPLYQIALRDQQIDVLMK